MYLDQVGAHPGFWQIGPRTVGHRTVGPRTVGPRGPTVQGPTVCPEKVANWAPDSWAPRPNCPGPNLPWPNLRRTHILGNVLGPFPGSGMAIGRRHRVQKSLLAFVWPFMAILNHDCHKGFGKGRNTSSQMYPNLNVKKCIGGGLN